MATQAMTARRGGLTFWRKHSVDMLLIFVSAIWGSTFLVIKETLTVSGPFTFLAVRCSIGALVLGLLFRSHLARLTRREVMSGALVGLFIFVALGTSVAGQQYTSVSKAGFITGLYVPLVPLLSIPFLRQWPTRFAILAVVQSVVGLGLLSLTNTFDLAFGPGEMLVLVGAVAAACHIISVGRFAPRMDAINLTIVQVAVAAVLSFIAVPIAGEAFTVATPAFWLSVLYMGVVATAFCFAVMNRVQQTMSSTRATLIYALEPAWAGLFGVLFAGDSFSPPALVGAGLIFGGMVVGEIRLRG